MRTRVDENSNSHLCFNANLTVFCWLLYALLRTEPANVLTRVHKSFRMLWAVDMNSGMLTARLTALMICVVKGISCPNFTHQLFLTVVFIILLQPLVRHFRELKKDLRSMKWSSRWSWFANRVLKLCYMLTDQSNSKGIRLNVFYFLRGILDGLRRRE